MRCKPGDLAVVVTSCHHPDKCRCALGRIIRVTTLNTAFSIPMWNHAGLVLCKKDGFPLGLFGDDILCPLPPPSDVETFDAQRELEHS